MICVLSWSSVGCEDLGDPNTLTACAPLSKISARETAADCVLREAVTPGKYSSLPLGKNTLTFAVEEVGDRGRVTVGEGGQRLLETGTDLRFSPDDSVRASSVCVGVGSQRQTLL